MEDGQVHGAAVLAELRRHQVVALTVHLDDAAFLYHVIRGQHQPVGADEEAG